VPDPRRELTEFRLGVVGGCMTHQRGIPLNALYHRRLGERLAADHGIRLRTHVVRAFEADLAGRLERLLAESAVDGVLVHLRSAPLVWATQLVRRPWRDGRFRVELNPALRRWAPAAEREAAAREGANDDAYGGAPDEQDRAPGGRRIAGFRIRDLNVAAGSLIGLDRIAIRAQLRELAAVERLAGARGLPIFVVGPTQVTYSSWTRRLVRRQERAIRAALARGRVPHALVGAVADEAGRQVTRADGTHLTIDGHAYVARQIARAGIGDWMAGIVAGRADPEHVAEVGATDPA
jgi:hypothetical protein